MIVVSKFVKHLHDFKSSQEFLGDKFSHHVNESKLNQKPEKISSSGKLEKFCFILIISLKAFEYV